MFVKDMRVCYRLPACGVAGVHGVCCICLWYALDKCFTQREGLIKPLMRVVHLRAECKMSASKREAQLLVVVPNGKPLSACVGLREPGL